MAWLRRALSAATTLGGDGPDQARPHDTQGVHVAGGSILGTRVQRKEDPKFLTSGGVYADDVNDPRLAGAAQAVYVRSTVAHGTIESIDISSALEMPGVLAIHTADSLGLEPVASPFNPASARTLLASDKVRHVGEPVAVVVALGAWRMIPHPVCKSSSGVA